MYSALKTFSHTTRTRLLFYSIIITLPTETSVRTDEKYKKNNRVIISKLYKKLDESPVYPCRVL